MLKIYLAGPDVFLPDALEVGRRKAALCESYGFEGLYPLDQEPSVEADAAAIFRANCDLMRRADIGLFNLSPFRGPSADAGTVFELGFLFAQSKPLYGYANNAANYRSRVAQIEGRPLLEQEGHFWSMDGCTVEDFGLSDNLMITRAIADSGGVILSRDPAAGMPAQEPLASFDAFELALGVLRQAFPPGEL